MPPPPPQQPAGRHCCIGITRFSEALRSRHLQPRCAGVHVVIQDVSAARPPARKAPAERTDPETPRQEPSVPPEDWRFTCYGFSEWTSGTAGATMPRCRFGIRPPREWSQTEADRENAPSPAHSSQGHKPTPRQKESSGPPMPENWQVTKPTSDWERIQKRLDTVRERWINTGHSLYVATGKTAAKIRDRDWSRDADRLQMSMNRTASRAADAATTTAKAVQRRIREIGNPD